MMMTLGYLGYYSSNETYNQFAISPNTKHQTICINGKQGVSNPSNKVIKFKPSSIHKDHHEFIIIQKHQHRKKNEPQSGKA